MIAFPTTMRALNLARLHDGRWQASLQTDAHESNAFSVGIAATVREAIAEVCVLHIEVPEVIAPPSFGV